MKTGRHHLAHGSSRRLFAAVLATALIGACFCAGCGAPARSVDGRDAESLQARVLRTGRLRAGFLVQDPAVRRDPATGRMSGVFVEALQQVCTNLQIDLEWTEEVAWGTMIQGLLTDRYDIVCVSVWPNAARARSADFSRPLYYDAVGAFVRAAEPRFVRPDEINSPEVRIVTCDGEMSEAIARIQFPRAQTVSLTQLSDNAQRLLEVRARHGDVALISFHEGFRFMAANPGQVKLACGGEPVRVFPCAFMFRTGEPGFKAMLDAAIEELQNLGVVDRLIDRYEAIPGTILRVASPYRLPAASPQN